MARTRDDDMSPHYKDTAEGIWEAGPLSDGYLRRNRDRGAERGPFWAKLQRQFQFSSTLEVGCGSGNNLMWIDGKIAGIDLHAPSLDLARERCPSADLRRASLVAIPFPPSSFDCVLSCGVLIHVPPKDLPRAMDEMCRVSGKWLLVMEYHDSAETAVPWRGEVLWRRPYSALFPARFTLKNVARGFLGEGSGFDALHWDLWRKGT